jgi:hypothetical protein
LALDKKVGSFSTGTGAVASTVVVTGVGFTPKAIIFWWSGTTSSTNSVTERDSFRGIGYAVSPTDRRCVGCSSDNASAGAATDHGHRADACIVGVGIGGGFNAMLDLQSMDVDGFTLVVDDAFPESRRISYLALGGSDIANAETEQLVMPSATGNVDYTTLGFEPEVVFFISAMQTANPPTENGDSIIMFGVATGSGQQFVVAGGSNDGSATTSTRTYHQDAECIARMGPALDGVMTGRAEFTSFLANGYRLNWLEGDAGANTRVHVLALGGTLKAKAGSLLSATSLTTIVTSGVGFLPNTLLLASGAMPESTQDTGTNADDDWSMGAADGTTEVVQATRDRDGVATTDVATGINLDNIYLRLNTSAASIDGSATWTSFDSDGFTLTQTDADPDAAFIGWLALGTAAAFAFSSAVAISGDGTLATTATTQRSGTVSVSAGGAVAATGTHQGVVSASIAGDGALSATAAKNGDQATSISGDGAVAATGQKNGQATIFIDGDGNIVAVGFKNGQVASQVSGDGAVSATGQKGAQSQVSIEGDGSPVSQPFAVVSVSGDGALSVAAAKNGQQATSISGDGAVTATGQKGAQSQVSVEGDGEVEILVGNVIVVSGDGAVAATGTKQAFVASSISGDGALAVAAAKAASASVTIGADGAVTVTSHKSAQVTASTSGDGALSATAAKDGEAATSISGDGAVATVGTKQAFSITLVVSGGGMEVVGEEGAFVAAELSGDGNVTVATAKTAQGSVTISGDGALEVAATTQRFSAVTISGDGLQPTTAVAFKGIVMMTLTLQQDSMAFELVPGETAGDAGSITFKLGF